MRWRCSRGSQALLADALDALTGEESHSDFGKQVNAKAASPMSVLIPGINPLSAMGLGHVNLGEAAQGWVDSVGSGFEGQGCRGTEDRRWECFGELVTDRVYDMNFT